MPTTNAIIKFKAGTSTNYAALANYDDNTLYFLTDTHQLFLGNVEYTKSNNNTLTAIPTSATKGEYGQLYYCTANTSLYVCGKTEGVATIWTRVANINDKNGTITSITAGDGLSGDTITQSGTIAHAVPTGAETGSVGQDANSNPSFGGTFKVLQVATDKFGHVTAKNEHTVTLPSVIGGSITGSATKFVSSVSVGSNGVLTGGTTEADTEITAASTGIPTSAAVKAYADNIISANDAMVFKGTLGTDGSVTSLPTNKYKVGWTYKVATADTYAGQKCEVGDMIIAIKNGPSTGTTVVAEDWSVIQTNIDGAVTHTTNMTTGQVVVADGAGEVKTTGFTIGASVPADAVFTDTTYDEVTASKPGLAPKLGNNNNAYAKVSEGALTYVPVSTIRSDLGTVGTTDSVTSATLVPAATTMAAEKILTPAGWTSAKDLDSSLAFTGATPAAAGSTGLVPAPAAGSISRVLRADGTWAKPTESLSGLTDTTITSPATNNVLKYNGTAWVNGTISKSEVGLGNVDNTADASKSVASAAKLTTARTIAVTGAVSGSAAFDGSENASIATTLNDVSSDKITAMTGYAKADNYAPVAAADSLNTAIGKLEAGISSATTALQWGSF